jgi:hypothetical protein
MGYDSGTPETTRVSFQSAGVTVDPTAVTFSYSNNGNSFGPFTYTGSSTPGIGYIYRTVTETPLETIISYSFQIATTGFTGEIVITWSSTGVGAASMTKSIEQNVDEIQGSVYSWAPGVDDVGTYLRARTMNRNGMIVGTFNAYTNPTDIAVMGLINDAAADVQAAIGPEVNVDPTLYPIAGDLAAIGAAMNVELSYFPEQVNSGRSPYPQLEKQYDDKLKRLQNAIVSLGGQRPTDESQTPFGAFDGPPVIMNWMYPRLG